MSLLSLSWNKRRLIIGILTEKKALRHQDPVNKLSQATYFLNNLTVKAQTETVIVCIDACILTGDGTSLYHDAQLVPSKATSEPRLVPQL